VAHDGDLPANNLTFSLSGAPAGASIDTHSGVFNWTPSEQQGPASYNFSVIVTDDAAQPLTASQLVHVTVNEVNTPPVLAFIGDRTVDQGSTLTFTATASDADLPANLLAFSLQNAPDGSSISASTGVFNWTPSASQAGSYTFSIEVADDASQRGVDSETITVIVNKLDPVLSIGDASIIEGDAGEHEAVFDVTLDDPVPGQTVAVAYRTATVRGRRNDRRKQRRCHCTGSGAPLA